MIVVDASAAIELLLRTPLASTAEGYVLSNEATAAPDLLNAEALQAIRVAERRGRLDAGRSRQAADDLVELPITRYPTLQLVDRAWALRHNFNAYDAAYVALAEALDAKLLTADQHLAAAVRAQMSVEVVLLA